MTVTFILAAISALVVVLAAAERIPRALAAFIRSCIPLVQALGEFRAALSPAIRHPTVPVPQPGDENNALPRFSGERTESFTAANAEEMPRTRGTTHIKTATTSG